MSSSIDERTPLLQFPGSDNIKPSADLGNAYKQFCDLIGNRPVDYPPGDRFVPPVDSLYHRATEQRRTQGFTYQFFAAFTNTLLLSQVVLGAALTGLAASNTSRVLITVFGALNTVIAGLVAFLKSRGQPMRARMFRDDLERVVDEIDNSATMWLGISSRVHGYEDIDTDGTVTVRSEVARLTRLYDRAVKTNTMNNPDFYGTGSPTDMHSAVLRDKSSQTVAAPAGPSAAVPAAGGGGDAAQLVAAPAAAAAVDPDESPATKAAVAAPPDEAPAKDSAGPVDDKPKDPSPADKDGSSDDKDAAASPDPGSAPAPAADAGQSAAADDKGKQPSAG